MKTTKEFNLSKKLMIFPRHHYLEEDVKEFIKILIYQAREIEDIDGTKTEDKFIPLEILNELAGDKLT